MHTFSSNMCPTGYITVLPFILCRAPTMCYYITIKKKKNRMKLRQADKYNINLLPLDVSVLYDLCAAFFSLLASSFTYNLGWYHTRFILFYRCMCTLALLFDAVIFQKKNEKSGETKKTVENIKVYHERFGEIRKKDHSHKVN